MSFRIHAAGSRGFRYTRDNQPDDDIFEAAAIISALNASGPSVGGVAEGVADYALPSVDVTDGARAVASMTFLWMLRDAVDLLSTCSRVSQGWISVAPRQENALWADTSAFARYEFSSRDSHGSEFIRTILPALRTTGLNNYGVFRALALAVADYHGHIGQSGPPTMLIQLTH